LPACVQRLLHVLGEVRVVERLPCRVSDDQERAVAVHERDVVDGPLLEHVREQRERVVPVTTPTSRQAPGAKHLVHLLPALVGE
jgi:hypothetical protein